MGRLSLCMSISQSACTVRSAAAYSAGMLTRPGKSLVEAREVWLRPRQDTVRPRPEMSHKL